MLNDLNVILILLLWFDLRDRQEIPINIIQLSVKLEIIQQGFEFIEFIQVLPNKDDEILAIGKKTSGFGDFWWEM